MAKVIRKFIYRPMSYVIINMGVVESLVRLWLDIFLSSVKVILNIFRVGGVIHGHYTIVNGLTWTTIFLAEYLSHLISKNVDIEESTLFGV